MTTAEVVQLSADATVEEVIAVIERDGVVIIRDFLSKETLEGLRADLYPQLEGTKTALTSEFDGKKTKRLGRVFERTRHIETITTNPLFLESARAFICRPLQAWAGEHRFTLAPELRIGFTQVIQIGPGQGEQPLHRDDTSFMWRHPDYGREARMQIMVAISDFTAENGGTLVIPGSNQWDDERMPKRSEAVPAAMPAGSAALFVGSTYHAGGTNTTDEPRTGLTMTFDAANVRQEENLYLSLTPEVVRSYPESVQKLLGWSAGENHMGWIEVDGQLVDPIVLLQGATFDRP